MPTATKRLARFLALVVGVAVVAVATFSLIRVTRPPPPKRFSISAPLGIAWSPTVAHPLPLSAKQVSLADAASALGALVALPNSALASPSDVAAVWMASVRDSTTGESRVAVAVTFPTRSLAIRYMRPAYPDPLANYENFVKAYPDGDKVIDLQGVPALVQTSTRPDGTTWDSVEFVRGGTIIVVMGNATESTLRGVAQSIVSRAASS